MKTRFFFKLYDYFIKYPFKRDVQKIQYAK